MSNMKSRLGLGGAGPFVGGSNQGQPSIGGNLGLSTNVTGSATGPALVLVLLTVALVAHYVWTKGEQGGR